MKRLVNLAMAIAVVATCARYSTAVEIASLDFANNGEDWSLIDVGGPSGGTLPILFEKGGDPTKVGFEHPNTSQWGQYVLQQRIDAPEGMVMSNIRLEALASGYSSWVMDGRVGFDIDPEVKFPLQQDYGTSAAEWPGNNGKEVVDFPIFLDASGDAEYTNIPFIYVDVEVDKILSWVSVHADVSQIKIYADLSPAPTLADYNNDGTVDAADYVFWRKTGVGGDPDGYNFWKETFGMSGAGAGGSTSGTVPEPSAFVTILGLVLPCLSKWRQRV